MKFGETEIIKKEGDVKLIKVGARYDRETYCVVGDGRTRFYEDYEDALEEYNLRWMKNKYGDSK